MCNNETLLLMKLCYRTVDRNFHMRSATAALRQPSLVGHLLAGDAECSWNALSIAELLWNSAWFKGILCDHVLEGVGQWHGDTFVSRPNEAVDNLLSFTTAQARLHLKILRVAPSLVCSQTRLLSATLITRQGYLWSQCIQYVQNSYTLHT